MQEFKNFKVLLIKAADKFTEQIQISISFSYFYFCLSIVQFMNFDEENIADNSPGIVGFQGDGIQVNFKLCKIACFLHTG